MSVSVHFEDVLSVYLTKLFLGYSQDLLTTCPKNKVRCEDDTNERTPRAFQVEILSLPSLEISHPQSEGDTTSDSL